MHDLRSSINLHRPIRPIAFSDSIAARGPAPAVGPGRGGRPRLVLGRGAGALHRPVQHLGPHRPPRAGARGDPRRPGQGPPDARGRRRRGPGPADPAGAGGPLGRRHLDGPGGHGRDPPRRDRDDGALARPAAAVRGARRPPPGPGHRPRGQHDLPDPPAGHRSPRPRRRQPAGRRPRGRLRSPLRGGAGARRDAARARWPTASPCPSPTWLGTRSCSRPKGTALRQDLDAEARRAGVTLVPQAEIDGVRLMASLAFEGYGSTIVPTTAVPGWFKGTFTRIPITDMARRQVGLARRRRTMLERGRTGRGRGPAGRHRRQGPAPEGRAGLTDGEGTAPRLRRSPTPAHPPRNWRGSVCTTGTIPRQKPSPRAPWRTGRSRDDGAAAVACGDGRRGAAGPDARRRAGHRRSARRPLGRGGAHGRLRAARGAVVDRVRHPGRGRARTAKDQRMPLVAHIASSGADIVEGMAALHGWGQAARAIAECSGVVPVIMVVDGPAVSGPALLLGLADFVDHDRGVVRVPLGTGDGGRVHRRRHRQRRARRAPPRTPARAARRPSSSPTRRPPSWPCASCSPTCRRTPTRSRRGGPTSTRRTA